LCLSRLVLHSGHLEQADLSLSDRYHIVAIDPRSQGRSTMLDHSNSPDDRATDLAGLLKALNLQKPVLVGWSQGVQDVAAFALKYGTADLAAWSRGRHRLSGRRRQDPKSRPRPSGACDLLERAARLPGSDDGYLFRKPSGE